MRISTWLMTMATLGIGYGVGKYDDHIFQLLNLIIENLGGPVACAC